MKPRFVLTTAITGVYLMTLLFATGKAQDHESLPPEASNQKDSAPPEIVPAAGAALPISQEVSLEVGKSTLIDSKLPIDRVSIGLGDFAVATAISPYEVLLNGKTPGATTMIIWQQGGSKLLYDVAVRPSEPVGDDRIEKIERQIQLEAGAEDIHLSEEHGAVFLRGKVKDVTSADRALSIASVLGKTVNLLYVDVPAAEPQILLRVKFASVDRSLANTLGLNLFSTGAANSIGSVGTEQFTPPTFSAAGPGQSPTVTLSDALNLFLFRPDLNLGATIKALEIKGVLEVLSEPNILARNGQQASFLAGGEFPFPVVQGSTGGGAAAVTIQFKEFGVRLNFLPTITARGSILLRIAPEVSALDFTNGLVVNGFSVPALTVRNMNTAVELDPGQSFAVGGLLDNRVTDTFEKIPFLGDIPVIGKFFQSRSRSKTNAELMVIVTPEIIQPVPAERKILGLTYPVPFLSANTSGDIGSQGSVPKPGASTKPADTAIPFEKLMKSLQMEEPKPLQGPQQGQQMSTPSLQAQPSGFGTPGGPAGKP